jgi:hypothetical protein
MNRKGVSTPELSHPKLMGQKGKTVHEEVD